MAVVVPKLVLLAVLAVEPVVELGFEVDVDVAVGDVYR